MIVIKLLLVMFLILVLGSSFTTALVVFFCLAFLIGMMNVAFSD